MIMHTKLTSRMRKQQDTLGRKLVNQVALPLKLLPAMKMKAVSKVAIAIPAGVPFPILFATLPIFTLLSLSIRDDRLSTERCPNKPIYPKCVFMDLAAAPFMHRMLSCNVAESLAMPCEHCVWDIQRARRATKCRDLRPSWYKFP